MNENNMNENNMNPVNQFVPNQNNNPVNNYVNNDYYVNKNIEPIVKEEKPKKDNKTILKIFVLLCLIAAGIFLWLMYQDSQKEVEVKKTYSETIREIIVSAKSMVEEIPEGEEDKFSDLDTTYYIYTKCIKGQENAKSPYGDLTDAYVVVAKDEDKVLYYYLGVDSKGNGILDLTLSDRVTEDIIRSKIPADSLDFTKGIGARTKVIVYNNKCETRELNSYSTGVTEVTKADYDNKKAIKINAVRNVSDEYTVTKVGIYFSSNPGLGYYSDDSKNLTLDEAYDVKKLLIENKSGNVGTKTALNPSNLGEFAVVYSVIKPTDVIYALPYVEATKEEKTYIFYGPVYSTTYNDVVLNN